MALLVNAFIIFALISLAAPSVWQAPLPMSVQTSRQPGPTLFSHLGPNAIRGGAYGPQNGIGVEALGGLIGKYNMVKFEDAVTVPPPAPNVGERPVRKGGTKFLAETAGRRSPVQPAYV
jgi:hypothetical protein